MRSYWSDPYLWLHLAGLAVLPLWLEVCLLGLAVGNPILPVWLELGLVGGLGILPILWMQLQRPFCIFSLVAVVVKPTQLTEMQRKLLTLFKMGRNQVLAIAVAIVMALILRQLYVYAPIAAEITPFRLESRWVGLLVAVIAFLQANLFIQVPVSVVSVLFAGETAFAAAPPYPPEQVRPNFTLLGLPLNRILPPVIVATPQAPKAEAEAEAVAASTAIAEPTPAVASPELAGSSEGVAHPEHSPAPDADGAIAPPPPETAATLPLEAPVVASESPAEPTSTEPVEERDTVDAPDEVAQDRTDRASPDPPSSAEPSSPGAETSADADPTPP